jgi:pyridoxamine 5'-phosphate oxidase
VDERDLDRDPLRQFQTWFGEAAEAGVEVPEAMALATATPDGRPSARMVLLKAADERGFAFHTNYESRKGEELAANPRAALLFHWRPAGRQVRVEGPVERVPAEESEAYFRTRPAGSRLAAWASPQSRPLPARAELDRLYEDAAARFPGEEVPLPPYWGGFRLVPEAYEFWQHRENRLHDRVRYERDAAGWKRLRLAP